MLNGSAIKQVDSINVFIDFKYQNDVLNRSSVCRKSYYGLSKSGVCYPGLPSDVKSFFMENHMCAVCNVRFLVYLRFKRCKSQS